MKQIIPFFIILPMLLAFAAPIISRFSKKLVAWLGVTVTLSLLVLSGLAYYLVYNQNTVIYQIGNWKAPIGINFVLDGFSALMLLIIALISSMVAIFSIDYMNKYTVKHKYFTLFMLMILGMNGLVLTGDLFNLYIFLEIAAIASYALVAFGCESEELEASFKYMIMGSVASSMILFGIVLLYSLTGSLNMGQISIMLAKIGPNPAMLLSLSLFIMGFGVKAAIVPFHGWLPDAHPSAPAPISAMLSGVLIKTIGFYALVRIIYNVFGITPEVSNILMVLGTLSMVVGVYLAIGQWDLKRLLAYHSISQMGYVILGIGIGTPLAIAGALFHLFNHAVFKSLLFLNSGAIEYNLGTRQLKKMGGLSKVMPTTAATSMVASMSIAGVPPFNGFWSKLTIIFAAVLAGHPIYAFFAMLVSVITLASFLKVQKYAFFESIKENCKNIKEVPLTMTIPMVTLAVICIGVGIFYPLFTSKILSPAVKAILNNIMYGKIVLGG